MKYILQFLSLLKAKRKLLLPISIYLTLFLNAFVFESVWAGCMPSGTKCYCDIDHVEYSSASACLASAACAGTTSTCAGGSSSPSDPKPTPTEMGISLSVEGSGTGKITTSEPGLQCQTSDCTRNSKGVMVCAETCKKMVKTASTITLTPVAEEPLSVFDGWGGILIV